MSRHQYPDDFRNLFSEWIYNTPIVFNTLRKKKQIMATIFVRSSFEIKTQSYLLPLLNFSYKNEKIFIYDNVEYILAFDEVIDREVLLKVKCTKAYTVGERCYTDFTEVILTGKVNSLLTTPPTNKIRVFFDGKQDEHKKLGNHIFELIRWYYNININLSYSYKGISWSLDNTEWFGLFYMEVRVGNVICTSCLEDIDIESAISGGKEEPLYFNLLREAQLMLDTNPRIALVMIAVSIEVGVKQFLISINPLRYSEYFKGTQSPPIPNLIRDDIRQLAPELKFSEEVITETLTIFNLRNSLVHNGEFGLNSDSLIRKFHIALDLLYYLDRYNGENWIRLGYHISRHRIDDF